MLGASWASGRRGCFWWKVLGGARLPRASLGLEASDAIIGAIADVEVVECECDGVGVGMEEVAVGNLYRGLLSVVLLFVKVLLSSTAELRCG